MNYLSVALIALAGAVVIIAVLAHLRSRTLRQNEQDADAVVLLFSDGALLDATPAAHDIFGDAGAKLGTLVDLLDHRFPELCAILQDKPDGICQLDCPEDDMIWAEVRCSQNTVRIAFFGNTQSLIPDDGQKARQDGQLMQDIRAFSPQMVWQEDQSGRIVWANTAFERFAEDRNPALFARFDRNVEDGTQKRQRVACLDDANHWFDVTTIKRDGGLLHFANDATALVRADEDRRSFVQTLGKTFADLSIGLAIFDKSRQLAMFNPALLDMTRLPVTFLSARPGVDSFLDRLRELRMMPEPKNYASWRDQFTAMEAAAKDGTYTENWTLPDGQAFRVTGRPHPNGAFAILFEDITAEVSLTRRFRTDIETSQAVLDTLPDAIAVFTGAGTMVISNAVYGKLWGTDTDLGLGHRDIRTEVCAWQENCVASPMWTQMSDFVQRIGSRKPWTENAMLVDGRHLCCHAIPIAGGMTMVRFVIAPPMRPVIQKLTQVDPAILARKG
ncbi:PAS-domain containing protein [Yoonia sp.]|uniref:PAS-domain containing protein n=1 Tax=Yoonia sp. TaxID=2212373 RepID=UPI003F4AC341